MFGFVPINVQYKDVKYAAVITGNCFQAFWSMFIIILVLQYVSVLNLSQTATPIVNS